MDNNLDITETQTRQFTLTEIAEGLGLFEERMEALAKYGSIDLVTAADLKDDLSKIKVNVLEADENEGSGEDVGMKILSQEELLKRIKQFEETIDKRSNGLERY